MLVTRISFYLLLKRWDSVYISKILNYTTLVSALCETDLIASQLHPKNLFSFQKELLKKSLHSEKIFNFKLSRARALNLNMLQYFFSK